jgi:hypothetical protein
MSRLGQLPGLVVRGAAPGRRGSLLDALAALNLLRGSLGDGQEGRWLADLRGDVGRGIRSGRGLVLGVIVVAAAVAAAGTTVCRQSSAGIRRRRT